MAKTKPIYKILIAGNGNVATALAAVLVKNGNTVYNWSRRKKNINNTIRITDINKLSENLDFILLSVADAAIKEVSEKLIPKNPKTIVLHCSGSTPLSDIHAKIINKGVLYPLQSISLGTATDWKKTPLLIEGNNPSTVLSIKKFASGLSDSVKEVPSDKRQKIHMAAVIVNNFTNHLYYKAYQLLNKEGVSDKLLTPLITETIYKALNKGPYNAQTGPARRADSKTISNHIKLLRTTDPSLYKIYKEISASIADVYKKQEEQNLIPLKRVTQKKS